MRYLQEEVWRVRWGIDLGLVLHLLGLHFQHTQHHHHHHHQQRASRPVRARGGGPVRCPPPNRTSRRRMWTAALPSLPSPSSSLLCAFGRTTPPQASSSRHQLSARQRQPTKHFLLSHLATSRSPGSRSALDFTPITSLRTSQRTSTMSCSSASESGGKDALCSREDRDVNMKVDEDATNKARGDGRSVKEDLIAQQVEPARVVTTFWHLPTEIRQRIFKSACGEPRLYHRKSPGLSTDCSKTIKKLALVSRSFHNDMTPLLYKHIRITRPSDLQILLNTLSTHALLGQLVRSIHVGPVDHVSQDWSPVQANDQGKDLFRIGLIDEAFEDLDMPTWLCRTHAFALEGEAEAGLDETVRTAIEAASDYLDVDLLQLARGRSGNWIGRVRHCFEQAWQLLTCSLHLQDSWHIRSLEVQAALELYLAEMGRRDQHLKRAMINDSPSDEIKPRYPRLVLQTDRDHTRDPPKPGEDVLWLSRSKILSHLTRRRARTDHFDHPHIFARANQPWYALGYNGVVQRGDADPLSDDEVPILGHSRARFFDPADAPFIRDLFKDLLGPGLPSTAIIGGILALTRSLFSFTPFVESVSLTGFLERAFSGIRPAPPLKMLRSLTLGPLPYGWRLPLRLDDPVFARLESLRVCGRELSEKDVDAIAGVGSSFKRSLRSFHWSLPDKFAKLHNMT